jgi:TP901 family phage tail tape measure protein
MSTTAINIAMDTSAVSSAAAKFVADLQSQKNVTIELTRQIADFNNKGDALRVILEGLSSTGERYTQTLARKRGALQTVRTEVEQNVAAQKRLSEVQEKLTQNTTNAVAAQTALKTAFQIPAGATINDINSIEASMQRVNKAMLDGKVSFEDFTNILTKLQTNPRQALDGLSESGARVAREIRNITKTIEEMNNKTSLVSSKRVTLPAGVNAGTLDTQLRVKFPAPETNDVTKLNAYETALQKVKRAVLEGKISFEDFTKIMTALGGAGGGAQAFAGLPAQSQTAANALRLLSRGFSDVQEETKKSDVAIGQFVSRVAALLVSQAITTSVNFIRNSFTEATQTAVEFSIKIAEIKTISQTSGKSINELADEVRTLSSAYGKDQLDVAKATYQAISNQVVQTGNSYKFMDEALRFSLATVSSTTDSVDLLSSALKAFDIDASQTDRVAASLFKTIELGRVTATEMAGTYGRVAIVARSVGVSMNELNAGIATLTVQGIKFNDASTFMSNLMIKLLQPTDKMKELFKQWGVATGEAAVATFGFEGVLQKLEGEAAKGSSEIESLFGQIRATRGVLGLTGSAFNDYQKNLAAASNATETYNKAVNIVAQSAGTKFTVEMNKAKVFFEKEWGEPLLDTINKVIDKFGGMEKVVETLTYAIAAGATAYGIYKVAVIASNTQIAIATILENLNTAALIADAEAAYAAAAGNSALAVSLRLGIAALIAYGAYKGFTYLIGEVHDFNDEMQKGTELAKQRQRAFEQSNSEQIQSQREAEIKVSQNISNELQKRYSAILTYSAAVVRQAEYVKDQQVQLSKDAAEETKLSAATFTDSLNKNINDFSQRITQAIDNIKGSTKEIGNINLGSDKMIYDTKYKYADDEQQIKMVGQEIDRLRQRAKTLFAEGSTESVREARKSYDEIEKLETQRFNADVERRKKAFEEGVGPGQVRERTDEFGRVRLEYVVQTSSYEARIKKIAEERIAMEKKFQVDQLSIQKENERFKEAEKGRLREIQAALKEVGEFDVGKTVEKFSQKDKALSPQEQAKKVGENFDQIIDKIRNLTTPAEQGNFQVFLDLEKQKRQVVIETESIIQAERSKTFQQETVNRLQGAKKAQADMEADVAKNKDKISQLSAQLRGFLDASKDLANTGRGTVDLPIFGPLSKEGQQESQKIEDSKEAKENLIQLADQAQKLQEIAMRDPSAENMKKFEKATWQAIFAVEEFVKLRAGPTNEFTLPGASPESTDVVLRRTKDQLNSLYESINAVQTTQAQLRQTSDQLVAENKKSSDLLEKIPLQFREVAGESELMKSRVVNSFTEAGSVIDDLTNKVINLQQQLQKIQMPDPNGNAEGRQFGGMMYYASGGFVPRGTDTIPAMLTRGEYVMDQRNTAKFYPILKAMSAGTYMQNGGPVGNTTTNVGDINITVNGGSNSQQTIREIGKGLQRGIRRRMIRLN